MKTIAAIAIGAVTAWASTASAGAAPAWCKDASFQDELESKDLSSTDPEVLIVAFAHAMCAPSAEAEVHRAEIDKSRAAWGKRLGMVEGDWADVIAWINAREGRDVRLEYSTKEVARFTPIDQYKAIVDGFSLSGGNGSYADPIYVADALGEGLSEVGRYGYLLRCLGASTSVTSSTPPAATWAVCQGDVESFDLAKFHAQLRADSEHGGEVKMMLRLAVFDLRKRLEEHAAAVQAAWKRDPVYKQMFETAAAARRDWASGLGKATQLLELAQRMDSAFWAGSRKQYEGCEAATAAALEAAVAKVPASTFKAMKDERFDPYGGFAATAGPVLAANPEVNLAASAYVQCRPRTGTSDFLAYYLANTVPMRGPRTAAFARMLTEKLTLDDMNERIYWPETERPYRRVGGTLGSAGGVVAKTKLEGNLVIVSLERLIVKQKECVESHATNKISRILPDGTIEYQRICDKMGVVTHDQTWGDFQIRKEYAPLLKKGVKFSAVNSPDDGGADVIVMWPDKKTEMPTWLLGARLK